MGFLGRFRKKKGKEAKVEDTDAEEIAALEAVCSDDKEAYEALYRVILIDPKKTEMPMEEVEEKAISTEKQGDKLKARIWYQLAGGLALYKGDVKNVKRYFNKCAKLSPDISYPILKIPERAVAKAQEYYEKYLK